MSAIPTWHERAMRHPDHQSGMVSEDMIRARMCEEIEDLRTEVERLRLADDLTRTALGSWVFVPPDGGAEPTHERVAAVVAEVDRLTRERDEARAEVERLREAIRTIRARCVELDDSDAVEATFDITNAVLDSKP